MFWCLLILTLPAYAQLLISEVFVSKSSWIEVYNAGDNPLDLANAQLRRVDGLARREAWRLSLPSESKLIRPHTYAIVAHEPDLGLDICLDVPIVIVPEKQLKLKKSGIQVICIQAQGQAEDCAQFSDSTPMMAGHSRYNSGQVLGGNDELRNWRYEDCLIAPNAFASPGSAGGFCHAGVVELPHRIVCETKESKVQTAEAVRDVGTPPRFVQLQIAQDEGDRIKLEYTLADDDPDEGFELLFYAGKLLLHEGANLDDKWHGETWLNLESLQDGPYEIVAVLRDRYGNETRQSLRGDIRERHRQVSEVGAVFEYTSLCVSEHMVFKWKVKSSHVGNVSVLLNEQGSLTPKYIAAAFFSLPNEDQSWVLANTQVVAQESSFRLVFEGVGERAVSEVLTCH